MNLSQQTTSSYINNRSFSKSDPKESVDDDLEKHDNTSQIENVKVGEKNYPQLDNAEKGLVDVELVISTIQNMENRDNRRQKCNSIMMIILIFGFLCNYALIWTE